MDKRKVENCINSIGTCVVFNCIKFTKDGKKDEENERTGSEHDGTKIKTTFSHFKYDVVTIVDPTKKDIIGEIKQMENEQINPYTNFSKKDFFICFILSHGSDSYCITTCDDDSIDLKSIVIEKLHEVQNLKGKIKIIIQQTCRGNLTDEGEIEGNQLTLKNMVPVYEPVIPVTSHPDFFILFSSTPGYQSYRGEQGSALIQMFCDMLEEHGAKLSLSELVQRLIFAISCIPVCLKYKENGKIKYKYVFQIPTFFSTLKSPLVLHHDKNDKTQDKREKDYEIKDHKVNKKRNNIISCLHERSTSYKNVPVYSSEKGRGYLLLTKQTPGSYDIHLQNGINYYLVIDIRKEKMTDNQVTPLVKKIENTMNTLHFSGQIITMEDIKDSNTKIIHVERYVQNDKPIGCFLCFIQLDEDQNTTTSEDIKKIICQLKGQNAFLDKPKVFILQPHVPDNISMADGSNISPSNKFPVQHPIKISKESDLLIIYSNPAKSKKRSLTEMFCETILKSTVSVIDLLETDLPNTCGKEWIDLKPSFSSTMRKHLVLTQKKNQENMKEENKTDEQLLRQFKTFKKQIVSADKISEVAASERLQQQHKKAAWTSKTMVRGCIMLAVCTCIVILSSIKLGLEKEGLQKHHFCESNHNQTLKESMMCENESRRKTILACDVTSFLINVSIAIVGSVVLINTKRNTIFKDNQPKRRIFYNVYGALCFAVSMISIILESVQINVAMSMQDFNKGQYSLSICIIVCFAGLLLLQSVVVLRNINSKKNQA